ncbi:MAG: hypothetical protein V4582_17160 [Pseudomonadota bacterium]
MIDKKAARAAQQKAMYIFAMSAAGALLGSTVGPWILRLVN